MKKVLISLDILDSEQSQVILFIPVLIGIVIVSYSHLFELLRHYDVCFHHLANE